MVLAFTCVILPKSCMHFANFPWIDFLVLGINTPGVSWLNLLCLLERMGVQEQCK